ncbi:MAG: sulfotransferase-like domain-containing protein [Planctomycetota bacterium]|jgi:hypothetical protein
MSDDPARVPEMLESAATPVRVAMWSGPRNISTAMMRSWEARGDTAVVDEPFYAHYLAETGLDHPGREAVLASQDPDWRRVVAGLLGPVPGDRPIHYQKHMSHHLLPSIGRGWLDEPSFVHGFLVRDPAAMVCSLARALGRVPELPETGLPQQVELFEHFTRRHGRPPAVLESEEVLRDPAAALAAFCRRIGVPWTPRMLRWPAGRRSTDGVWAPHWYATVEASTGFGPPREPLPDAAVPGELRPLVAACREHHERLLAGRVIPE